MSIAEHGTATETPGRDALIARARQAEADGDLFAAIADFTAALRIAPDDKLEGRLVRLRHDAFYRQPRGAGRPDWPPAYPDLFEGCTGIPEVHARDLTSDLVGSAILHHGCLLVRELLDRETATQLAGDIDIAMDAYAKRLAGAPAAEVRPWCALFEPDQEYGPFDVASGRHFLSHHGSMYTADSPHLLFEFTEALEKVGLRDILAGHLGERPAMSVKKGTLRRVPHDTGSGWHQDGAFLGEGIRTVNVWLTLTDCSGAPEGRAPGLEIVPRRFEEILETGTHGAIFDWSVGDGLADQIAQETPTIKPVYRAGDAMLFDELLLHRTSVHPEMDTNRYTIETWFFAPSAYPDEQVAIAF